MIATLGRFAREQIVELAAAAVAAAFLLSGRVTWDRAKSAIDSDLLLLLFVIIPVTIIASRMSDFDIEDAVVLQIIAANLLGCLTPLGNPQNLFIYHQAGWDAGR